MRITSFAIAGALMACAVAAAGAATRAESWKPTYSTCEALALNRGILVTERRGTDVGPSPYRQFMVSCLSGKVEGKPIVTARIAPAPQIPARWDSCEELATRRGIEVNERGEKENGASPWRQFMVACLTGKIR